LLQLFIHEDRSYTGIFHGAVALDVVYSGAKLSATELSRAH
jgi:hypothetical protein